MRKFYLLFSLLFVASFGFAQYLTKADARDQKISKPIYVQQNEVMFSTTRSVIFEESFEFTSNALENGWTSVDNDGDGNGWFVYTAAGAAHTGELCVGSASWDQTSGALTPDNWLISPQITLPESGTIMLGFFVGAQDPSWPAEKYKVAVSTTGTNVTDFTEIYSQTLSNGNWIEKSLNLSDYAGEDVHIAIVHYDCSDNFILKLDDFSVFTNESIDAGITEILAPNNDEDCALATAEEITIEIINNGGSDITGFEVSYSVNGGDPVVETVSDVIAPAATLEYTFATTVDLSALETYTIEATVSLTDDSNENNNTLSMDITSGDAVITIHAFTDAMGGQSWQVINNLTSEVVAERTIGWQWEVEVTEEICVIDANCYTVIVSDEDGMVDETAYLEILYNGVQVAGSTEPDSFTGPELVAENLGSGCPQLDAEMLEIDPIFSACGLAMEEVTVHVKNAGAEAITEFDVQYVVNGGDPVVENVTETIEAGETYTYTFTTQVDLSVSGEYVIVATVTLDGDENASNNEATTEVTNIAPVAVPYSSNFDDETSLMGWAIENTNEDESSWTIAEGVGVDGSNAAAYSYNSANAADDWLFSTCLDLQAGQAYFARFQFAVNSADYPEKLAVYFGNAQESTEMTLIYDIGEVTNEDFQTAMYEFTPETAGTYYIGIHCYSDADQWNLFIDDFMVDVSTNVSENLVSQISVFPNPANDYINVLNAENQNIVVMNMLGSVVASVENATDNQTIDMSNLPNGTYFVRVNSEVFKISVVK